MHIKEKIYNYFLSLTKLYHDPFSYRASALAFTTLLSIVPMISVCVYLLTHFFIFDKINELAKNYVITTFVPTSSSAIIPYLNKFSIQTTKLPVVSILFLFITTVIQMITIDDSMSMIWNEETKTKGLSSYLIYGIILLLIPVLIILSALLSAFLFYLLQYLPGYVFISFIIPLFINTILLSLLYYFTSNTKLKWTDLLSGAFIAALLLNVAKIIFDIYINKFSNYALIYGALAIFPVFLLWIYIFWLIILYGACVVKINHTISKKYNMID